MDLTNTHTQKIIKQVSNISRLEERIFSLPIEPNWLRAIQEKSIVSSSIHSYFLEGGQYRLSAEEDIDLLSDSVIKHRLLNEIELRRSFPIYFKNPELDIEIFSYLHRFLDNVYDEQAKQRGQYRKSQDVAEGKMMGRTDLFPRYGFIPRLLNKFVAETNEMNTNEFLLAGLAHFKFAGIAPFIRGNFQIARIISEGIIYSRKKNSQVLDFNQYFAHHPRVYIKHLKKGIEGHVEEWLSYYLEGIIMSMKNYARNIELYSGGTLKPLSGRVVDLTKRQKSIVELLRKRRQMSGSEIAEILGVTRQNIFTIMQKLIQRNIVEKVGKGSTSRYQLVTK